jgi:hypothetical protein
MEAEHETWLLVVSGSARAASFDVTTGDAIFSQSDQVTIHAGRNGLIGLVAYTAPLVRQLLKRVDTEPIQ